MQSELFAFGAFDVTFAQLERFPGMLWLAPEPREPFVDMTHALMARFPDYRPYDGLFEGITPHLTVAQGADLAADEDEIKPLVPLRSRASSVVLFEQVSAERWDQRAELAL